MGRLRRASGKLPRVRPTSRGWQVLLVVAVLLAAALSLGTTQLYQLAYALLGLLVAAFTLGLVGSRALSVERRLSHREGIVAGEPTTVSLRLANRSRLDLSRVELVDRLPHRSVFRSQSVPAEGGQLLETTVSFARRGLYAIGPVWVASTDPFGLLRFWRNAGLETEALVYPEVYDVEGLPVRGGDEAGGGIHSMVRGEEFSGLREYRPGDDRRFIHWKSLARTGELMVREFDPDAPRRYSVALDLHGHRTDPAGQELEAAVSAAASSISHLYGAGLTYRLRLMDRLASSTGFGTGEGNYHAAMRLLAAAEADDNTEAGDALAQEASEGRLGEGVILVACGASKDLASALREVRSRGVAVVVILVASHTYAPQGEYRVQEAHQEARFEELVQEMQGTGATVRVLRRESGMAGLSEARSREAA